ncbi:MAG: pyridoxal phosphate-dependent aminotransferase [Spirochaetales bacterium]|nr:pyridoxal phosphate-dependent aminotransferase [Spirochaetales bacterium]
MRTRIVHEGVKHLEYEIRKIVEIGLQMETLGVDMRWENIGDPVAMGEKIEPWIAEIIHELVNQDKSWAYCPSKGVNETREFIASEVNKRGGAQVCADDILFFNGIADAVDKVYDLVHKDNRIIMASPSYPTHSSNEAKRGDYPRVYFRLDPRNNWQPDLEELENKVKYNPQIIGIGLVHPDNPTGMVYSKDALTEIVRIAREHNLFVICDEIYAHITFNGAPVLHLSTVIEDVPALSLRGISKEYPWPGSRCGWIEMLNRHKDPDFSEYCRALVNAKMMEVCSTTLPQMSIPLVMGNPLYPEHLKTRAAIFEKRAQETYDAFKDIPGVIVNRTSGAFYFSLVFKKGALTDKQTLPIKNTEVKSMVEKLVEGVPNDKRFVYYLMGAEGICVTPLCGFFTDLEGFRITYLQADDGIRRNTLSRIADAVKRYLGS